MNIVAIGLTPLILAALAGCAGELGADGTTGDAGDDAGGSGPQRYSEQDTHPDFPGAVLRADLTVRGGDEWILHANATNEGQRTYRVSNICVEPWQESMREVQGEQVFPREPEAHCEAFGLGPWPPGAQDNLTLVWDGRIWGEDGMEDAPPGDYVWNVSFELYDEGDSVEYEGHGFLTVQLIVTVRD
jgi:hypothetical protein